MSIKVGDKDLFPYLGDYRPINIYKGEHKLAGWKWAEHSGEELYFENTYNDFVDVEIDGKSVGGISGKNLVSGSSSEWKNINNIATHTFQHFIPEGNLVISDLGIAEGEFFTTSVVVKNNSKPMYYRAEFFNSLSDRISVTSEIIQPTSTPVRLTITTKMLSGYEWLRLQFTTSPSPDSLSVDYSEIQLEKGSIATAYEPPVPTPDYPIAINSLNDFDVVSQKSEGGTIDKINLLLSEPLRSVGDVKDRLFRDSDGLWKVGRNVGERVFDGSEDWSIDDNSTYSNTVCRFELTGSIDAKELPDDSQTPLIVSNMFSSGQLNYSIRTRNGVTQDAGGSSIYVFTDKASNLSEFEAFLSNSNLEIIYENANPIIETLDQELQDKLNNLRSFQDSNYVYTTGSIKPNLIGKAKVKDV